MSDYLIYYIESNLVCFIIFTIVLVHDVVSRDRQEKQIKYDHALIAFMCYFVSDSVWAMIIKEVLPKTTVSVILLNMVNYIVMSAITYMWLRYVMAVELVPNRERKINKFAVLFPFIVSTLAIIVTYIVSPDTLINEALEIQMSYYIFQISVPIIYIVAIIFYTLRRAKDEDNMMEKRRHIYMGMFPLILLIGGLLQVAVLPNTPVFCFCCTLMMLPLYIQDMDTRISMDPLTKLNNKGQLMRYVSQEGNIHLEGRLTYVIMIDVNNFKGINDTLGHAEGDKALFIIAEALRNVAGRCSMPTFIGRFGRDEFVIIAYPATDKEIEPFVTDIRNEVEKICKENNTSYILSVGVGYDELMGSQDSFQKCLQRADRKLYIDKDYCKMNGNNTVFL